MTVKKEGVERQLQLLFKGRRVVYGMKGDIKVAIKPKRSKPIGIGADCLDMIVQMKDKIPN